MSACQTFPPAQSRLIEVKMLRNEAARLLEQLRANRADSEQRLAELGQRDAVKLVTGRSAIERAIDTTRELIAAADATVVAQTSRL